MKRILVYALAVVFLAALSPLAASAQSGDLPEFAQTPFYINVGGFLTSVNTDARIDSTLYGIGTGLDFESDLGLDNSPLVWRLDAGWRIAPKHQLIFSYFQINRDETWVLNRNINWEDYTLAAGTHVKTSWDSNFYQIYYRYSFMQGSWGEWGITGGISYLRQEAGIEGAATLRNGVATTAYYEKAYETVNAPIPVIGLFGTWQAAPKFVVNAYLNYLQVDVDNVNGAYTDAALSGAYYFTENFGLGLGWYYNKYDVEATKSNFNGEFTYDFNGPAAYLSFKW